MKKKAIALTILMVIVALFAAIYFLYDPSSGDIFFPKCPFFMLTGYQCPGCGSQRAIHSLLHGNVAEAIRYNALVVPALALIIIYMCDQFFGSPDSRLRRFVNHPNFILGVLIIIVMWWIFRNFV